MKEVTEEKVIMMEDIHTECQGCLYRWCGVGIRIQGRQMIHTVCSSMYKKGLYGMFLR